MSTNKFNVGAKVLCVKDYFKHITLNRVYTVISVRNKRYCVHTDTGGIGWYTESVFEAVAPTNEYITPEEVFKHLRGGTKLQWCCKSTLNWLDHSGELNHIKLNELIDYGWRVKPEPEIITLNGKRYQALED